MATRKYSKKSCHSSKSAATTAAKKMRKAGNTASVRKSAKGVFCVYSAGKMKTTATKKTGSTGVRRRRKKKA